MRCTRINQARGRSLRRPDRNLFLPLLACALVAVLHGCGPAWSPEQRQPGAQDYQLTADGRYRVRRGDSLYAIAFNFGLDWRDVADWNGIGPPYVIYPDQDLKMSPPPSRSGSTAVTRPAQLPKGSSTRESNSAATPSGQGRPAEPGSATGSDSAAPAGASASPAPAQRPDPGKWLWPTEGRVVSGFRANDPSRNGIDIGGVEGQAVLAAAAGEVVYSGSGLIGYGELIIIKHSDRMLSAYAHNKRRLVAEGDTIAVGQQVGEMGRNDRNQAMLHFEIRVNGTPQDPLIYLPKR